MTREGAIGNLIHAIRWNDMPKKEALDMAIQALKQEPKTEPKYCDHNICVSNEYNGIGCDECEVTKSQEPKTGHWKRNETIRLTYCSKCGFGQHIDEFRTYNFCPNCGAKMESEE